MESFSGAVRRACDIQVEDRRGPGRPKLTWKKLTESDYHEWRSGVMWMMPLHLHFFLNQKSDYDMIYRNAHNESE